MNTYKHITLGEHKKIKAFLRIRQNYYTDRLAITVTLAIVMQAKFYPLPFQLAEQ